MARRALFPEQSGPEGARVEVFEGQMCAVPNPAAISPYCERLLFRPTHKNTAGAVGPDSRASRCVGKVGTALKVRACTVSTTQDNAPSSVGEVVNRTLPWSKDQS